MANMYVPNVNTNYGGSNATASFQNSLTSASQALLSASEKRRLANERAMDDLWKRKEYEDQKAKRDAAEGRASDIHKEQMATFEREKVKRDTKKRYDEQIGSNLKAFKPLGVNMEGVDEKFTDDINKLAEKFNADNIKTPDAEYTKSLSAMNKLVTDRYKTFEAVNKKARQSKANVYNQVRRLATDLGATRAEADLEAQNYTKSMMSDADKIALINDSANKQFQNKMDLYNAQIKELKVNDKLSGMSNTPKAYTKAVNDLMGSDAYANADEGDRDLMLKLLESYKVAGVPAANLSSAVIASKGNSEFYNLVGDNYDDEKLNERIASQLASLKVARPSLTQPALPTYQGDFSRQTKTKDELIKMYNKLNNIKTVSTNTGKVTKATPKFSKSLIGALGSPKDGDVLNYYKNSRDKFEDEYSDLDTKQKGVVQELTGYTGEEEPKEEIVITDTISDEDSLDNQDKMFKGNTQFNPDLWNPDKSFMENTNTYAGDDDKGVSNAAKYRKFVSGLSTEELSKYIDSIKDKNHKEDAIAMMREDTAGGAFSNFITDTGDVFRGAGNFLTDARGFLASGAKVGTDYLFGDSREKGYVEPTMDSLQKQHQADNPDITADREKSKFRDRLSQIILQAEGHKAPYRFRNNFEPSLRSYISGSTQPIGSTWDTQHWDNPIVDNRDVNTTKVNMGKPMRSIDDINSSVDENNSSTNIPTKDVPKVFSYGQEKPGYTSRYEYLKATAAEDAAASAALDAQMAALKVVKDVNNTTPYIDTDSYKSASLKAINIAADMNKNIATNDDFKAKVLAINNDTNSSNLAKKKAMDDLLAQRRLVGYKGNAVDPTDTNATLTPSLSGKATTAKENTLGYKTGLKQYPYSSVVGLRDEHHDKAAQYEASNIFFELAPTYKATDNSAASNQLANAVSFRRLQEKYFPNVVLRDLTPVEARTLIKQAVDKLKSEQ